MSFYGSSWVRHLRVVRLYDVCTDKMTVDFYAVLVNL